MSAAATTSGGPSATILPPLRPGVGADFDQPVGGFQDVEIVLDDDDAVAAIDQRLQNAEEAFDVVAVQTGGRLVEEQQGAGGWPDLRGFAFDGGVCSCGRPLNASEIADELQPLRFAAAERVERLAEREVAEADRIEAGESRVNRGVLGEERQRIGHAGREQVGDGAAVPLNREDLGFEAPSLRRRGRARRRPRETASRRARSRGPGNDRNDLRRC